MTTPWLPNRRFIVGNGALSLAVASFNLKAQEDASGALIIGLITRDSLYITAVIKNAAGIDWSTRLADVQITPDGENIKELFGKKAPRVLYLHNLRGQYLDKQAVAIWKRKTKIEIGLGGDNGFALSRPTNKGIYLVASQVMTPAAQQTSVTLTREEINRLQTRFRKDALDKTKEHGLEDEVSAHLKRTNVAYAGHKTTFPGSQWVATTLRSRRIERGLKTDLELTWINAPGAKTVAYCAFSDEAMLSLRVLGFWCLPGQTNPLIFLKDANKAGISYPVSMGSLEDLKTFDLGGSGC